MNQKYNNNLSGDQDMHVTPKDIAASVGTDPSLKPEDLLCRYLRENTIVRFEGVVELFNDCGLIITEEELLSLLDMRDDLLFTEGRDARGRFWKASIIEGYVDNRMEQGFESEFDLGQGYDEFDPDAQDTEWDTGELDPEGSELSGINAPPDAAEMTDVNSEYEPEPPEVTAPATDQSEIPPGAMPLPMPEIVAQAMAAQDPGEDPYGMEEPMGMDPEGMDPEAMMPGPMGMDRGMEGPTQPEAEGPLEPGPMGPGMEPGSMGAGMGPGMGPGPEMPAQREPGMTVQPGPGEEMPSQAQPGMAMQQPGMQQPGMQQPGMQQPGMRQPEMQQPGMRQPEMQQPGMRQPGMQPQVPEPQPSFADDEVDYTIDPFLDQMKNFTGESAGPTGEIPPQSPQTANEPATGAMTKRKRLHPARYSDRMKEAQGKRHKTISENIADQMG